MNIETKRIVCMDSILHWQHPDFGLISQDEFFHIAENNNTIISIGEWILRNVCHQIQEWASLSSTPLTAGVQIPLRQVEHPHFVNKVFQILQETKIEPSHLLLEFSETIFTNNLDKVEKTLHQLKHIGVQIGIADFGAGNIALQHLRRFPVDFLKISSALIQDVTVNKESEAIIGMIIALANNLQRRVIAEGVESKNQKDLLAEMGCRFMQGGFFSQPILPQEFSKKIEKNILEVME